MKNIFTVIPARINSKRLPRKVLEKINGKPMITHVVEKCLEINDPSKVIVLSDSNDVLNLFKNSPIVTFLTSSKCNSGTDRICSIIDKIIKACDSKPEDIGIINVQADQPFVDPNIIREIKNHLISFPEIEAFTPVYKLSQDEIINPNVVKVIRKNDNNAIYFSRYPLPYMRDKNLSEWAVHHQYWGHIGIYGYRASLLLRWNNLNASKLELAEKLEQLKLIESGINIKTIEVENNFDSIDTLEDLDKLRKKFLRPNKFS